MMTSDKGQRSATVIPETSLSDRLTSHPDNPDTGLDRAIQARIGDHLRAVYADLMQQPIPDRFKDLLQQLDDDRSGETR